MNLFVAKLNQSTTSQDLQKLFSHYGYVSSVKVIFDHFTGKSKGYGFVEMPNNNEATEALQELDASVFHEATITVKNSQAPRMSSDVAATQSISDQLVKIWSRQDYTRDTTTNNDSSRNEHIRRNYGYRGSGLRNFGHP